MRWWITSLSGTVYQLYLTGVAVVVIVVIRVRTGIYFIVFQNAFVIEHIEVWFWTCILVAYDKLDEFLLFVMMILIYHMLPWINAPPQIPPGQAENTLKYPPFDHSDT